MKLIKLLLGGHFLIFSGLSILPAPAQKQANIWYFGDKAGLNFNSGVPVALTDGQINTLEGCASIADKNGNLLFYTDGSKVWDAHHLVMPNGRDLLGNTSATQSAMIAPVLGNNNQYYIFTADGATTSGGPLNQWDGLNYSIIDITLPGNGTISSPLGDLISTSKNISLTDSVAEKVTAVKHTNGKDYWIVTQKQFSPKIYAFLVTCLGVNTTPVISTVANYPSFLAGTGYLTPSLDGKTIVQADPWGGIFIRSFNATTGVVTDIAKIGGTKNIPQGGWYGVAFSPNDSLIYVTKQTKLLQYQRYATDIGASEKEYTLSNSNTGYALELATDGKIYIALEFSNSLSVINNPNSISNPDVQVNSVGLETGVSNYGLPNVFLSYFASAGSVFDHSQTCIGENTFFTFHPTESTDSVRWNFGDPSSGILNTSGEFNPSHTYSVSGDYTVKMINYSKCIPADTISLTITIYPLPLVDLGEDTTICDNDTLELTAGGNESTYLWSNGSNNPTIKAQSEEIYSVVCTNKTTGCVNSDTIVVTHKKCESLFIPNVFSPNNDGVNDLFKITVWGFKLFRLIIYNRWGEKIFETENSTDYWNGKNRDTNTPDGTYYYCIHAVTSVDKEFEKTGYVTLLK